MKLKRALIRGLAVCLALTAVTATAEQQAIAVGGPSVNAPDVKSVAVSNGSLSSRGPDDATTRALKGDQPAAGSQQGGGSFTATPLSASASWEVSKQSGDFSWAYPLRIPPAPGGYTPALSLSYRSSAVDGLTSATNNQPSWIGDGWDLSAGHIERSYGGCADDIEGGTTPPKTGDLCWRSDNATASFGGKGGMLVKDDATGVWRLKSDDRSRVEKIVTPGNGDRFNESWKITTVDGTQYFFGSRPDSRSTWTVPVFGDDAGEPCHESTFDASSCDRAWRWMLDKAVDPHGNVILYNYETETNRYGKNLKDTAVPYVRAGNLRSIEYGLNERVPAPATGRVEFGLENRCVKESNCSFGTKENWPDAAVSENCDGATCTDKYGPTFWSTKRLSTITTQVRNGTEYKNVDRWTLQHEFPKTDDAYQAALWLKSIKHTGLVGGEISLPEVTFEGTAKPNRVDAPTGIGPLNRYRVTGVISEAGGVTQVKYANPDCVPGQSMPTSPETNDKRCYPVKWAPPNGAEREDYFHKYVVESITSSDRVAVSAEQFVRYEYLDGAAWRRSQAEFVQEDKKTYSEFRGFGRVRVKRGKDGLADEPVTMTEDRFYRGMHGDKLPNNATRTAKVTDSEGGEREDSDWLSGLAYESRTHRGTTDDVEAKSISTPAWAGPTATRGEYKAYWTGPSTTTTYTSLRAGGRRVTRSEVKHDDHGQVIEFNDLADLATDADDRCTTTSYLADEARWKWSYADRSETVAVRCGVTPSFPGQALNGYKNTYDGFSNLTKVESVDQRPAAGPVWTTSVSTTYDDYGRIRTVTDVLGNVTKTDYVPESGGPATGAVVTDALGHAVTSTIEPAWGTPVKLVDANENVHEAAFDAVGRTTHVWRPNRPREEFADDPSQTISYDVKRDAPTSMTVATLAPNGNYLTTTRVFDGQLRPRQVQSQANGGRLITDTRYDSQGRVVRATKPFFNNQAVDTNLLVFSEAEVPGLDRMVFDGVGRVQASIFQAGGQEKWRTTTAYGGDRVDVTPPAGRTPTTTITDARGQSTELWQYHGATASGDHDVTRYGYSAAGKLTSATDAAGNTWRWEYDLRGRQTRTEDPDKGTSTLTYDALDRLATVTDARNTTLTYTYDALSRTTSVKSGATVLQEFTFDTAGYGKGLPASATRYVNGNAYTTTVKAYSSLNAPLSTETKIPDVEGPLKGVYKVSQVYAPDGSPKSVGYGAITSANFPAETVLTEFDDFGRPIKTSAGLSGMGTDTLVNSATYTRYGEPYRLELGVTGKRTWLSSYYEDNTRRLNRYIVDAEVPSPKQADVNYALDDGGNVKSVVDTAGTVADRQCFQYDHLRRLTQAWTPSGECSAAPATSSLSGPAPYWQSFSYDAAGNRTKEVRHAAAGDLVRDYRYPAAGSPRPHAVTSVAVAGPGVNQTDEFTYSASGDTATRKVGTTNQQLEWDVEGRVVKITAGDQATEFLYTPDGTRLIRRDKDATTLYLGGQELRLAKGATTPTVTRYYTHGGATVAMRQGKTDLTWLASDHQGTNQIAINRSTLQVERKRQLPFGEVRGAASSFPGERGFVGGTNDASTGLVGIGARQYDAALGKFISVDPIMDVSDPQQWNAYAYSNNSPVTFSDPTGLQYCDDHVCSGDKGYDPKCTNCPGAITNNDGVGNYSNGMQRDQRLGQTWVNGVKMPSNSKTDLRTLVSIADRWKPQHERDNGKLVEPRDTVTLLIMTCWSHRKANLCDDEMNKGLRRLDNEFLFAGEGAEFMLSGSSPGMSAESVKKLYGVGHGKRIGGWAEDNSPAPKSVKEPRCNCFPAGTSVSTEKGAKPIEQIEVGDRVWARNLLTGESELRTVASLFQKEATELLTIAAGGVEVKVTPEHPFWVHGKGWVLAGNLVVGDELVSLKGPKVVIRSITSAAAAVTVYNFEVEGRNNYYISESQLLVHNCAARRPGRAPEYKGGELREDQAMEAAMKWLGPGYKDMGAGRFRSDGGQGLRQVRYGTHETRTGPNHHIHFEAYDQKGENGKVVENTMAVIVP